MKKPKIIIKKDFDGYFKKLVEGWVEQKVASGKKFNNKEIVVIGVPRMLSAITYKQEDQRITLCFYSALRSGFGLLTEQEIKEVIALL